MDLVRRRSGAASLGIADVHRDTGLVSGDRPDESLGDAAERHDVTGGIAVERNDLSPRRLAVPARDQRGGLHLGIGIQVGVCDLVDLQAVLVRAVQDHTCPLRQLLGTALACPTDAAQPRRNRDPAGRQLGDRERTTLARRRGDDRRSR